MIRLRGAPSHSLAQSRTLGIPIGPCFAEDARMLNIDLAEGVRRVGFRKWYERELLTSHAHMVLAFLAVIGMLGSFEAMRGGGTGDEKALNILFVLACAA